MVDTAFFWIASGGKYAREAVASAQSAKRNMPDVLAFVGCPDGIGYNEETMLRRTFDGVYRLQAGGHKRWFLDHNKYMRDMLHRLYDAGIKYAIYMDTDTYVCYPVYELFGLVKNRCIFAGIHAPVRELSKTINPIPACFPEFNIGVNPMLVDPCRRLFDKVYSRHREHVDIYENNDQGVLREILWENPDAFPVYVIPPEYNLRLFCGFVKGRVKILHGRVDGTGYPAFEQKVNATLRMRVLYKGEINEV